MSRTDGDDGDARRSVTDDAPADDWDHRHAHVDPPASDALVRADDPDDDWGDRHGRTKRHG